MKTCIRFGFLLAIVSALALAPACKSQYEGAERSVRVKNTQPPAENIAELLRRQPNIVVTGSGNNVKVQIRGTKSFNATNQPLYFVDRMNMGHDFSRISNLNPGDVERIEVVKDPASLASYGVGASNGVVIVHLKK